MAILTTADNQQLAQCDGCGRSDAGPGAPLLVQEYAVLDPNGPGATTHHYCTGCAANRGSTRREILTFGWTAGPVPGKGEGETEEQHLAAMRGEPSEGQVDPDAEPERPARRRAADDRRN